MSPQQKFAQERLDEWLKTHPLPDRRQDRVLRHLINQLLAAVRYEEPSERPF